MKTESFAFSGAEHTPLHALIHLPDAAPKLVLQVIHGMTEHIGRYAALAEELAAHGIALAGFDLRGHGQNNPSGDCASFGEGGWQKSLQDIALFHALLKEKYPDAAHCMLGFSLGSFLLRDLLSDMRYANGIRLSGAVIAGSGQQPAFILSILMVLVRQEIKKHGFDRATPLVDQLSLESYNQKFSKQKGSFEWLLADRVQREAYLSDPLSKRHISAGLFCQLLSAMKRAARPDVCSLWRKDMPVLLLSGGSDPVGDCGKGVRKIHSDMKKAGLERVQTHLIPDARHDLFHEIEGGQTAQAVSILLEWMKSL